jgi:hypothetical protein
MSAKEKDKEVKKKKAPSKTASRKKKEPVEAEAKTEVEVNSASEPKVEVEPKPEIKPKKEESVERKGVEFHGFVFNSTPIEEAIFAHVVKRIGEIQFPKLFYSHIRGAVHSWVSGTAVDAVILLLISNEIMEHTEYKGRPALQFKRKELRNYPVKSQFAGAGPEKR